MLSRVEFEKKWPTKAALSEAIGSSPEKFLILYDRELTKNPDFKKWLAGFEYSYGLGAGEDLKDFSRLSSRLEKIYERVTPFSAKNLCMVGVGGGSIGDFVGFVASVTKRGVPLIHIPTTFLACMDSAHGGKTALNLGSFKNQIGSFYPAQAVFIVQSALESLPQEQLRSATGELAKMALIEGGELFSALKTFELGFETTWQLLPKVIAAKYRWVEKDPLEKLGEREILNLGHTLGHVLESHYKIPHGMAVAQGLIFVVLWSHHQGYLSASNEREILDVLHQRLGFLTPEQFTRKHRAISPSKLSKLIYQDKKLIDGRHVSFVFLRGLGEPFRKKMTVESFITETQRQGWTSL